MPYPRHIPLVWAYHDVPRFFYVLRKWFDDPLDNTSTAAQVVVISANEPLDRHEVRQRLKDLDVGDCDEFVLIDTNPECAIVLDTWERAIEGSMHPDMPVPCRCFRNWWDADECEEVEEGEG